MLSALADLHNYAAVACIQKSTDFLSFCSLMTASASSAALHVLIVDGDELSRERLEKLLDSIGRGSLGVASLDQAREAMKAIYFPLVILDRHLTDGDGIEVCREYRSANRNSGVSIMLLSATDSPQSLQEGLAAGADDCVSKACDDAELLMRINALCNRGPRLAPAEESARLASLDSYQIMDTLPEQAYDDITRLASFICKTPIALISLIDDKRQWFKSRVGIDVTSTERELAFCTHAILNPTDVMVVPDATRDPRFANNPLVTGEPQVRFYAGAPLLTEDGSALGTLCVVDDRPRDLDEESRHALASLSRQVVQLLKMRRATIQQPWVEHVPQMIELIRWLSQQPCVQPHSASCAACSASALLTKANFPVTV
jgi:CheY-like chemotaxis protein